MSEADDPQKKSWGCLPWGVVLVVVSLGLGFAITTHLAMKELADTSSACHNAHEIIRAVKDYAADHDGAYPDAKVPEALNSNEVFRALFREEITADESLFGAKGSPFIPDGKISHAPGFDGALTAGENHWALVARQNEKIPEYYPLVFENALDASWPPEWRPYVRWQAVRARTWRRNMIVVGFNDTSIVMEVLEKAGNFVTLPEKVLKPAGREAVPNWKVLDVEDGRSAP